MALVLIIVYGQVCENVFFCWLYVRAIPVSY